MATPIKARREKEEELTKEEEALLDALEKIPTKKSWAPRSKEEELPEPIQVMVKNGPSGTPERRKVRKWVPFEITEEMTHSAEVGKAGKIVAPACLRNYVQPGDHFLVSRIPLCELFAERGVRNRWAEKEEALISGKVKQIVVPIWEFFLRIANGGPRAQMRNMKGIFVKEVKVSPPDFYILTCDQGNIQELPLAFTERTFDLMFRHIDSLVAYSSIGDQCHFDGAKCREVVKNTTYALRGHWSTLMGLGAQMEVLTPIPATNLSAGVMNYLVPIRPLSAIGMKKESGEKEIFFIIGSTSLNGSRLFARIAIPEKAGKIWKEETYTITGKKETRYRCQYPIPTTFAQGYWSYGWQARRAIVGLTCEDGRILCFGRDAMTGYEPREGFTREKPFEEETTNLDPYTVDWEAASKFAELYPPPPPLPPGIPDTEENRRKMDDRPVIKAQIDEALRKKEENAYLGVPALGYKCDGLSGFGRTGELCLDFYHEFLMHRCEYESAPIVYDEGKKNRILIAIPHQTTPFTLYGKKRNCAIIRLARGKAREFFDGEKWVSEIEKETDCFLAGIVASALMVAPFMKADSYPNMYVPKVTQAQAVARALAESDKFVRSLSSVFEQQAALDKIAGYLILSPRGWFEKWLRLARGEGSNALLPQ